MQAAVSSRLNTHLRLHLQCLHLSLLLLNITLEVFYPPCHLVQTNVEVIDFKADLHLVALETNDTELVLENNQ
jgi:hypothetical protein